MKHKHSKKLSSKDKDDKQGGKKKLKRKEYEKQLLELQGELCALQEWVKATGQRLSLIHI